MPGAQGLTARAVVAVVVLGACIAAGVLADDTELEVWDVATTFNEWEAIQGEDKSLVMLVVPDGGACDSECQALEAVVRNVKDSLLMDVHTRVVRVELPPGSNDVGSVFGPALQLSHSVVDRAAVLFGLGTHKVVVRYLGDAVVDEVLEGLVNARFVGPPLDDTECLNNDLDDIAMLALDPAISIDQLITDTKWHMEIMDGFELECAQIYLTTLERIKARGGAYVGKEKARLGSLVRSRSTPQSARVKMQRKINVLGQFEIGDLSNCNGQMCGDPAQHNDL